MTAIRSLSASISLLIFPSIYWLCRELFGTQLWLSVIALALMAISPIHLVYPQEARKYILWVVTILLYNASLLWVLRLESIHQAPRILNWGIYAVTLTISLYTFLFSGFVAIAHKIYLIIIARFRLTRTFRAYLLASIVGLLAFTSWILLVITNFLQFDSSTVWTKTRFPLEILIKSWLYSWAKFFYI